MKNICKCYYYEGIYNFNNKSKNRMQNKNSNLSEKKQGDENAIGLILLMLSEIKIHFMLLVQEKNKTKKLFDNICLHSIYNIFVFLIVCLCIKYMNM